MEDVCSQKDLKQLIPNYGDHAQYQNDVPLVSAWQEKSCWSLAWLIGVIIFRIFDFMDVFMDLTFVSF